MPACRIYKAKARGGILAFVAAIAEVGQNSPEPDWVTYVRERLLLENTHKLIESTQKGNDTDFMLPLFGTAVFHRLRLTKVSRGFVLAGGVQKVAQDFYAQRQSFSKELIEYISFEGALIEADGFAIPGDVLSQIWLAVASTNIASASDDFDQFVMAIPSEFDTMLSTPKSERSEASQTQIEEAIGEIEGVTEELAFIRSKLLDYVSFCADIPEILPVLETLLANLRRIKSELLRVR
jgi:hypothetical protein